jgi:hypothetical protein
MIASRLSFVGVCTIVVVWNNVISCIGNFYGGTASQLQDTIFYNQSTSSLISEFPPLLPPSDWLNDVQVDEPASCGAFKCLYGSKRGNRLGYLVAQWRKNHDKAPTGHKSFKTLQQGYELAERLRISYSVRHLLLAPPSKVDCTAHVCEEELNRNVYIAGSQKSKTTGQHFTRPDVEKPHTKILVQPVEMAAEPIIQFGLSRNKFRAAMDDVKGYASNLQITDLAIFEHRLRQDIEQALGLVQTEPCLLTDFQFLLDGYGRLYHLDFDRCFENDSKQQEMQASKFLRIRNMVIDFADALIRLVKEKHGHTEASR